MANWSIALAAAIIGATGAAAQASLLTAASTGAVAGGCRGDGWSPLQRVGLNAAKPDTAPGEHFWRAIRDSNDPALFEAYLERSRRGQFAGRHTGAAKARLDALQGSADAEPAAKDRPSTDEQMSGFKTLDVARTVTVHAQPMFGADSMGKLAAGDTVTAKITSVDGPWRKIVLEGGKTGYVLEDPFAKTRKFE